MRQKKEVQYKNEREELCSRIIEILELDHEGCFMLSDFENNPEKQNKILNIKEEIQKYFVVSSINVFKPSVESTKRPYINIIRAILRQQGYTFESGTCWIKCDTGVYTTATKYKIFRKNE